MSEETERQVAERGIRALYTHLLGRDAEPEGIASHVEKALEHGTAAYLGRSIAQFALSPEGQLATSRRLIASMARFAPPGEADFAEIFSLGTHCYSSWLLKLLGIKRRSGPFDWIFSNPGMVAHCIEDRFVTFLDRVHHGDVAPADRPDPHACKGQHHWYREAYGVHFVFNHHQPASSDADFDYFRRCVARLLAALDGDAPVLLPMFTTAGADDAARFERLADALEPYPAASLMQVTVAPPSDAPLPRIEPIARRGRHEALRLTPISPWGALSFANPIDDVAAARLIARYRFTPD